MIDKAFPAAAIDPDDIRAQVERIVASPLFSSSSRLPRFLRFLIEQELSGQGSRLDERTIAIEVFERDENFRPGTDKVVRVYGARLRRKLRQYYSSAGESDPVVLILTRTSYVPQYRAQDQSAFLSWRRAGLVLAAAAVTCLVVMGGIRWSNQPSMPPLSAPISLAVLPFADASPGKSQSYLCDSITEEVRSAVGRFPGLRVIAPTSARRAHQSMLEGPLKSEPPPQPLISSLLYGAPPLLQAIPVKTVAEKLKANLILTGRVLRDDERLRVTIQLLDGHTGARAWEDSFDRAANDASVIHDDIAASVARALKPSLGTQPVTIHTRRYAGKPEAYAQYLKARYGKLGFSKRVFPEVIALYDQALAGDPEFAAGWMGKALTYINVAVTLQVRPRDMEKHVREALQKVLQLDPSMAEAYWTRCVLQRFIELDRNGAEKSVRRALELNPSLAEAHLAFGYLLLSTGRPAEQERELNLAEQLDPLSINASIARLILSFYQRDFDRTIALAKSAPPGMDRATLRLWSARAYMGKGMREEAIEEFKAIPTAIEPTSQIGFLTHYYFLTGRKEEARSILEQALAKTGVYVNPIRVAQVYIGLGDYNNAMRYLNQALEDRVFEVADLPVEPVYDPIREDSRFRDLMRRANLSSTEAAQRSGGQ